MPHKERSFSTPDGWLLANPVTGRPYHQEEIQKTHIRKAGVSVPGFLLLRYPIISARRARRAEAHSKSQEPTPVLGNFARNLDHTIAAALMGQARITAPSA